MTEHAGRETRAQARARMEAAILAAAHRQLRENGAAALSLRAVAAEIGVVSSAVYRYVSSRDELLTRLLVDSFTSLADAVDAAVDAAKPSPRAQLGALAGALHDWASTHPEQWALLYGTPVPGYSAPEEQTQAPGTRVMAALLRITAHGRPRLPAPSPDYAAYLRDGAVELGVAATPEQGAAAVLAWNALTGAVGTDVFGLFGADARAHGREVVLTTAEALAPLLGLD